MPTIKNLGLVRAIHVGTSAPANTNMLWYDDNIGIKRHKYFDTDISAWVLLISDEIVNLLQPSETIEATTNGQKIFNFTIDLNSTCKCVIDDSAPIVTARYTVTGTNQITLTIGIRKGQKLTAWN